MKTINQTKEKTMKTAILTVAAALLLLPVLSAQARKGGGGGATVEKNFKVGADCKISTTNTNKAAAVLADLKTNDKVTVVYHEDGDKLVADSVTVMGEPKGDKPAKGDQPKAPKAKGEKGKAAGPQIHGLITSVDVQTGTITVSVHERKPKPTE